MIQGWALLRPGTRLDRRMIGVIGRAQKLHGVKIHAVGFLFTHDHQLCSFVDTEQQAAFLQHVQSKGTRACLLEGGGTTSWLVGPDVLLTEKDFTSPSNIVLTQPLFLEQMSWEEYQAYVRKFVARQREPEPRARAPGAV